MEATRAPPLARPEFIALVAELALGAGRIRWQVLPDNEAAKQLYRRWGGQPDPVWESWEMALPGPA